ncbi:hypothetical protein MCOR03_007820 [Pyricularia oryzae]|nr:hypothetical protein MCOR03_007820 [Pyricularia oryzae]
MLRYLRGQKEKENPTSDALPTTTIPRDTHPAKPAATPAATPAKDASPDPTPQESAQATQQQAATAHPDHLGGRQEPPEAGAQRRQAAGPQAPPHQPLPRLQGGAEQQQQQQAVAGEDLGYMLSAAVCEMLDDALEGRLEMGIFADGFGGGEETPEEAGLVAPLCLRVVDDEPVSPRTVPAGFERGWFLSLGDETPESTESESPDSEIFARQV